MPRVCGRSMLGFFGIPVVLKPEEVSLISLRSINLRGWICVLFAASFAVAQSQKPSTPPKVPTVSHSPAATKAPESVVVPSDAAVITIPGVCDKPPLKSPAPADCKTVITRAEFERLVDAVAPTIAPAGRKQLATQYAVALAMVQKAHEQGLDKGPKFDELMKVARVGVLTKELSQKMQDEAGKISDQEVATYYH